MPAARAAGWTRALAGANSPPRAPATLTRSSVSSRERNWYTSSPSPRSLLATRPARSRASCGGRRRHRQPAALHEVAGDRLAPRRPARPRRRWTASSASSARTPAGPARGPRVAVPRSRQLRGHPAAVAPGGAVPGERRLEHDDPPAGAQPGEVIGGPQPGVAAAHDADVRFCRPGQRRPPGRKSAERPPPVGDFAVTHGVNGTRWPDRAGASVRCVRR